jgi:protein-L-isoaspartate(D-aspartate) O-methyltransferase
MPIAALVVSLMIWALVAPGAVASEPDADTMRRQRSQMVTRQIAARGIKDDAVLRAMATIPRHRFVPQGLIGRAYGDHPLPIGEGQTISQPYIVALMTEVLQLSKADRVLEIGTGSGYQAAVLAQVAGEVYTIEIKEKLYEKAHRLLQTLGLSEISVRHADGYFGWPQKAPFDGIMITAAVDHIPPPLLKQMKDNARLVLPLGNPFSYQNLVLVTKKGDDFTVDQITGVLFVPMTGHALSAGSNR